MGDKSSFTIGKVTGVHGVKGYVRAASFAESPATFKPGLQLMVNWPEGQKTWLEILKVSPHKGGLLILFNGMDRNLAETLRGQELFIKRDDLPTLEEDTYYWEDLIGLEVTDMHQGTLGKIKSVMATGSNDVFVVTGKDREVLIPALAWVVKDVDLNAGTMLVDLPEGL